MVSRHSLNSKCSVRRASGNTLCEFVPVMWILIMVVFFPILDLLSLTSAYVVVYTMNSVQVREAALMPRSACETGPKITTQIPSQWMDSGPGRFANMSSQTTTVRYTAATTDDTGIQDWLVSVDTACTFKPFLTVPFPISVAGLNAPMTITMSGERPVEDPENYNK